MHIAFFLCVDLELVDDAAGQVNPLERSVLVVAVWVDAYCVGEQVVLSHPIQRICAIVNPRQSAIESLEEVVQVIITLDAQLGTRPIKLVINTVNGLLAIILFSSNIPV